MVSKKKLAIAATGLLLLATACGGAATPTATPTTPATVAPTAEATVEATEVVMEMTEEATAEATVEATEVVMEMTEEATMEATEVAMEMTEEATLEATEVVMEMTEEATVEATEVVVEPTAEATEVVMETTPEATMVAPNKEVGNAIVALIQVAAMQMTPSPTPEATMEATAEMTAEATMQATVESTAEATADVVSSTTTEATAEATMELVVATPAPETTQAEGGIVWTCPEDFSGQSLNIYNWAEYIGASTITDFMELCPGVEVTMDYFDTNETLITKLRAGNPGFDIAIPSDYAVQILADENLLEPIDLANIPNMANVEQRWKEMYFDPGNVYGVPYLWSSFGILYDKTKVTTPPVSWMDYFTYDGPISWMDDYRGMFGAAFWLMGTDPSTVDPVEIEKAATFLKENGSNAVMIQGGFMEPMLAGEVDMILTYSAYSYYAQQQCECDDYVYVVPAEGSAIDTQEVVLLKGNDSKRLAEAFMDYLHDPYVNAQLTNDTGYNSTNEAAIASGFIKPEIVNNPALFMSPDDANRLEFYRPITEAEGLYQQYWDEIRISLGL